jgi:hypothetical protein
MLVITGSYFNNLICRVMNEANLASGAQYARLGLTISNGVIDAVDGYFTIGGMQEILKNENFIREISKRITSEVLAIPIDPWADQKKKIERFYKSVFNFTIDWSTMTLPEYDEKRPRLEYVNTEFNCKRYINAYKKKFGDNSVAGNSYSQDPDSAIHEQQDRPKGNYCFAWEGSIEPDAEHLNKGYDDFYNDGNKYMIPKEGIIAAFRERFETGNMLDVKGLTRFHALDSDGNALYMCRFALGQFDVGYGNRDGRDSDRGPRQISF